MIKLIDYVKNVSNIFPADATYYAPFDNADFRGQLVDYIMTAYSNLQIRPTLEDYVDGIPDLVISLLNSKKYSYVKLWETTQLEYNPIENYSMSESGKDTTSGTTSNTIGSQTSESSGNNNTTYGQAVQTGKNTNTKTGSQTDGRYITPYDTENELLAEKTKTDYSNIKDSSESSVTTAEHTDNSTTTANTTIGGRTDNGTNSSSATHEFKRSGNIGVTTSQQMLQSQRDIAMFNFMAIVAHDIIKLITIGIYD